MELSMSGGALRTFTRCVTYLARVDYDSDLVLQAHPAKLELHTLNSSQSAYASVSLARDLFDHFHLSAAAPASTPLQCSVLLKSVLSALRTPTAALDRLVISLPHPDAPKLQLTLHSLNCVRKTYWIACSAEPEVQTMALDRGRFPSRLAIRPRDLAHLLSNFQSSLQELTVIATEPGAGLPDVGDGVVGKAVELRSYIDPTKDDCDTRLHTQLWIDPVEEFLEYVHTGDPVDVTFGVKELKAFLTFCEGCEVDILLFFEKAGEPVLLVPKFAMDDGSNSDFDATLVLATMLVSQLIDANVAQQPATSARHAEEPRAAATPSVVPENVSNHTKIWSELSGSAPKSFEANREEHEASASLLNDTSMLPNVKALPASHQPQIMQTKLSVINPRSQHHLSNWEELLVQTTPHVSKHHPSNWVGADEGSNDDEDEELLVQTTPEELLVQTTPHVSKHHPSNWVGTDEDSDDDEDEELLVQTTPEELLVQTTPHVSKHHPSNWVGADEGNEDDEDEELLVQTTPHVSKHHPSNWVGSDEGSDDDEDEELLVQTTPHYMD